MATRKRWIAAAAALSAGFVLAGCPAPPPTPPTCPDTPDGAWFGSWDGSYGRGIAEADLQFDGATITGTATLQYSSGGTGTVSGTVDCDRVTLNISKPDYGETTFVGTITDDSLGSTISAVYAEAAFTTPTTIPTRPEQGRLQIGWTVDPDIPTDTTVTTIPG